MAWASVVAGQCRVTVDGRDGPGSALGFHQPKGSDLFAPKQLGRGLDLGLVCRSPVLMVRNGPRSSADVCRRCHAVRHSPRESGPTSCGVCSPSSSARPGRASSSHLGDGSNATCLSSSCCGSCLGPSANRTSPASTHPCPSPSRWSAWDPGIQPEPPCLHSAGRIAGGIE